MSLRLMFGLSLLGLAMAVATVFVVPLRIEPALWVGIFVFSAVLIAKRAPRSFFLHGVLVSLLDSVWVAGAHAALFDQYVHGHGHVVAMAARYGSPLMVLALAAVAAGIAAGVLLGVLAWVSSKFVVSSQSEFAGW